MTRQSAMGSSKYEFEVEEFEKDFIDKMETANMFREDLEKVLYTDYEYRDNKKMSKEWKRIILTEVHKKFIEG